tara:strand:- start:1240 stop:2586 length:1347 start_codon:yes stop_codon:yes gene_type:complete
MNNYSRNRFRLETTSTKTTLKPQDVITVSLPESALLDMKSFRMVFDAKSTKKVSGTEIPVFPASMLSLIERIEVYINGVQVQQGCSQYNTVCHILNIGRGNNDHKDSAENISMKSHVDDLTADGSLTAPDKACVIDKWYGFLNETSTRFLDTSLLGQIQVRLTLAPATVMIPFDDTNSKGFAMDISTNGLPTTADFPASLNYELSSLYFTIDSIVVDPIYSMTLRDQLSREEYIPINYKEYYTYTLGGQNINKYQNRFALSSSSIDKMYAVTRLNTYADGTQKALLVTAQGGAAIQAGGGGDAHIAPYFAFTSLDEPSASSTDKNNDFTYTWSINNVQRPQYRAKLIEAATDLAYVNDKCGDYSAGVLPTSFSNFKTAQCVISCVLSHPDTPISVKSGLDSRGINSQMVFDAQGLNTQEARKGYESMVVVETTASLRVTSGRSLGVIH